MPITTSPVASGSGLFGGLFGTAQGNPSGLFGMLLSLFGPSAQTAQVNALTNAATQTLTGLPLQSAPQQTMNLLQQAGLIDQNGAILAAGTGNGETSLPSPADVLSALQLLAQSPTASPELKTLLSGSDDLKTLHDKIVQLDDDQQQSLLGEIAALLMPPAAPQTAPVPTGEGETAIDTEALALAKDQAPLPPPLDDKSEQPTLASDDAPAEGDQAALQALNRLLHAAQKSEQQNTEATAARSLTEASTAEAAATAQHTLRGETQRIHTENTTENRVETMVTAQKTSAQADAQSSADQDAAAAMQLTRNADQITMATTAAATQAPLAAQAAPAPHQTTALSKAADTAQPVADVKVTPATAHQAGHQTGNMNSQGGQSQDGEAAAQAASDQIQTTSTDATSAASSAKPVSFAEHVTKASLSRTGANVPVSEQIAVQMSHALKDGQNQMTIKLHPADLGRIDVKIDVSTDGRVTASFSVEQPSTLDLLTKDQRGLERSLSDAGLKTDSGTLSFNLRNDNGSSQQQSANTNTQQDNGSGAYARALPDSAESDEAVPAGLIEMVWHMSPDRVDVRI